jgi:hypothetical protein
MTHQYKVNYIMPNWYEVTFEAPANLSEEEVWDYMVKNKIYHEGSECDWSRMEPQFWDDEIGDSESESIRNITKDEILWEM